MENKLNSGAIFKVENRTSENQPHYRGTVNVDGVDKQISLWINVTKDGNKSYFSVKISEPYKKQEQTPVNNQAKDEDSLPF